VRLVFAFLLIISAGSARSESSSNGLASLCESVQMVANFTGQFSVVPWPVVQQAVVPVPGVVWATLEGDSVLLDFCMVIKQFQKMEGYNKVMKAVQYGNALTNEKYNEHIEFATSTFDIYSSTMNYAESGDGISEAEALVLSRRLNHYLDSSEEYYNGQTGRTEETFATRAQREMKMRRLVSSANNISRYSELLRCPEGKEVDENLADVFGKDMQEKREAFQVWENDVTFLMDAMDNMGVKFSSNQQEMKEYLQALWGLYNAGVKYNSEVRTYNKKTTKFDKAAGKTREVNEPMAYQKFGITKNPRLFESFRRKYVPKWSTYVIREVMASGSAGLLDSPGQRVEKDFRFLQFECRRSRVERVLLEKEPFLTEGKNSPDFERAVGDEIKRCESAGADDSKAKNLMNYYVGELSTALEAMKRSQADMWTIESYHLGTTRNISVSSQETEVGSIMREEVSCGQKISPAEVAQLQARLESERVELRGELVEEMLKKTAMLQAKKDRQERERKEEMRRRELEIERKRRSESDYAPYVKFPEMKESF